MGKILLFLISLLVAPALGWFAAVYGTGELVASSGLGSLADVATFCGTPEGTRQEGCEILATLQLLHRGSIIAFCVSIGLPLVYLAAAMVLGRSRNLLARWFPPLVWVVLGVLPLLLVVHGVLIWVASWELIQLGIIPGNLKLMLFLALLGGGLVLAALTIVTAMRRLLAVDPLRITGVELQPHELPALFARVKRLASKLGSREPERIILGVEPTAFVANVPVRLRNVGDIPRAYTLYLPTGALRLLDDAELDALIGHELGHFRGEDLEFSSRFAPVFRSLGIAVESVAADEDDEGNLPRAAIPAIGLLSFMIYTLNRIVSRIGRLREFAADQAALEVSNARAITSLLVKFSVLSMQWEGFRYGFGVLLHQGVARRNISVDYIARTRQFMAAVPQEELRRVLLEAHTPHPLDSHPSLMQRATAVGLDASTAIVPSLTALQSDRPVLDGLLAIEERITMIDVDYYRHPGSPVQVADDPELPPELRFTRE